MLKSLALLVGLVICTVALAQNTTAPTPRHQAPPRHITPTIRIRLLPSCSFGLKAILIPFIMVK